MALFAKKTESNKKEKTEEVAATSVEPVTVSNVVFSIIKPRISEKSAALAKMGKYVFLVKKDTNKVEVKKAVEKNYKVHVTQVNIINNKPKSVNFGRTRGTRSGFKKAVVTLRKGETIESTEVK
jgi:large subunit ribosomal protein L23